MLLGEAKSLTRAWVEAHTPGLASYHGSFMTGSAIWRSDEEHLPPTSDIDVTLVLDEPLPPVKLGKILHQGVLLDVSYLSSREVQSPEDVLGSYYLAPSFARLSFLHDPAGRFQALADAVVPEYGRRDWIRKRCEHGWSNAARHFSALSPSLPLHIQAIIWLFGTAASTIVLLCAGLRNPTVRTRYLAARKLLDEYGMLDQYESFLEDLGCATMSRETVARHLSTLETAFDEAATVVKSPYRFASDISPDARPIAIDGSRDLIERGYHREAVFYIVATFGRCQTIIQQDGSPEQFARHERGLKALLADLGIHSFDDFAARISRIDAVKSRTWETAEAIMAANPDVLS